jgi:hypothetical protein
VQLNHSRSQRGTLRGLHFQAPPHAQGKLVGVVRGAIFDVVVDLRRGSPTYGRWAGTTLDDERHELLWVPPGFAHGFLVTSDVADVLYQVDAGYAPAAEGGLPGTTPTWRSPGRSRRARRRRCRPDAPGRPWPSCARRSPDRLVRWHAPRRARAAGRASAALPRKGYAEGRMATAGPPVHERRRSTGRAARRQAARGTVRCPRPAVRSPRHRLALVEPLALLALRAAAARAGEGRPVPQHLGIIMDGNRRFARALGLDPKAGHDYGAGKARDVLRWCLDLGIRHVTLWGFSTDNRGRDPDEVAHLHRLFAAQAREFLSDTELHRTACGCG